VPAGANHVELVQLLLEHKASVHVRDNKTETPLHIAAQFGYAEAVLQLLQHGADVTTRSDYGQTPLHLAARFGYAEAVLQLLQHGADVTTKNDYLETPLMSAVRVGKEVVAVVRHLLQYRSNVSTVDAQSRMPLHWAAFMGHAAVVGLLLEHGANVLTADATGNTAEDYADLEPHHEVVAILKAEAVTRAKCVAFAMGNQERLGVGSRVLWLDPGVVRMVIALV
jgi:ankyrin repeat protein